MRHLILTILLGFSSWALAQRVAFEPDTLSALNPWTDQEFAQPDDLFQFAVIGDLTGGYRSGVFPVAVDKANAVSPDFVISVGDLIEGYTKDTAQIQRWWNQFDKWVGKLQWTVYDHDHLEDQYKGTKALWQNPFPGSGTFFLQKTKH